MRGEWISILFIQQYEVLQSERVSKYPVPLSHIYTSLWRSAFGESVTIDKVLRREIQREVISMMIRIK